MTREIAQENGTIPANSVFTLRPEERVTVGDRTGTVDRVDGTGTVYVCFGETREIDGARLVEEFSADEIERAS